MHQSRLETKTLTMMTSSFPPKSLSGISSLSLGQISRSPGFSFLASRLSTVYCRPSRLLPSFGGASRELYQYSSEGSVHRRTVFADFLSQQVEPDGFGNRLTRARAVDHGMDQVILLNPGSMVLSDSKGAPAGTSISEMFMSTETSPFPTTSLIAPALSKPSSDDRNRRRAGLQP